jgi:hypothetical protein
MWNAAPSVFQQCRLPTDIVLPVGTDSTPSDFVVDRHCLWGLLPAPRSHFTRPIRVKPGNMLLAGMWLSSKTPLEFQTELESQEAQPVIMLQTLPGPNCTRMIRIMDRKVAANPTAVQRRRRKARKSPNRHLCTPMRRVEELGSLQNHLDDVLITMPTRTASWIGM